MADFVVSLQVRLLNPQKIKHTVNLTKPMAISIRMTNFVSLGISHIEWLKVESG
jgi:hypothetical protein